MSDDGSWLVVVFVVLAIALLRTCSAAVDIAEHTERIARSLHKMERRTSPAEDAGTAH